MKFIAKISTIISCLFFLSMVIYPNLAKADGMIIKPDTDRWDYYRENNQQAFINFENGTQKMIISISTEEKIQKGLWIFPIPADPNKVTIDVEENLPTLYGEEISQKAKSNLDEAQELSFISQIYSTLFLSVLGTPPITTTKDLTTTSFGLGAPEGETEVQVYEHLDKDGITTEILTAKTANSLFDYLKGKDLKIEQGQIPILDQYIGKDFTFVVSWISPTSTNIEISNDDIFRFLYDYFLVQPNKYPIFDEFMKTYEQKNECLKNQSEIDRSYYESGQIWSGRFDCLENPQNTQLKEDLYQEIRANVNFINYVKELKTEQANSQTDSSSIGKYPINYNRGVFVSFPTDKIYFPLQPTSVYGSETIPITIKVVGFVSPVIFQDIKSYAEVKYYLGDNIDLQNQKFLSQNPAELKYTKIEINSPSKLFTDDLWINSQAPTKVYYDQFFAKHPYIPGLILFMIISMISSLAAGITVFKDFRNKKGILKFTLFGLFNFLTLIGFVIATVFLKTKIIRPEDQPLFDKLKKKGYNPAALQTRDLRKIAFVPIFSILFLILSWGLIELLKLSL